MELKIVLILWFLDIRKNLVDLGKNQLIFSTNFLSNRKKFQQNDGIPDNTRLILSFSILNFLLNFLSGIIIAIKQVYKRL